MLSGITAGGAAIAAFLLRGMVGESRPLLAFALLCAAFFGAYELRSLTIIEGLGSTVLAAAGEGKGGVFHLVLRCLSIYNDIVKNTPPMGPSPSRVLGDAGEPTPPPLDPARLRVLRELAGADRACTVGELAQALGGHPNTTRHHLRALLAAGLVAILGVGARLPETRRATGSRPLGVGASLLAVLSNPVTRGYGLAAGLMFGCLVALSLIHISEPTRPY